MKRTAYPFFVSLLLIVPLAGRADLTEGPYTYTISDGKATITAFDNTYSGALSITNELGGRPVTIINYEAFERCTSLTSVTIPNSVTSIGHRAFRNCTNLTNIMIPDSVTFIGSSAFYQCSKLTCVSIPDNVTSISDSTFWMCVDLTNVNIGASVTTVGSFAFLGCSGLTRVTIPDSVITIGGRAFLSCISLSSVTIPSSVTTIDYDAFDACPSLKRIYFAGEPPDFFFRGLDGNVPTLYYLPPFASFWGSSFANCPTKLWDPVFANTTFSPGQVSLSVTGSPPIPIALEATTTLNSGTWVRLCTTNLTASSIILQDSDAASHPTRFYRIIGP